MESVIFQGVEDGKADFFIGWGYDFYEGRKEYANGDSGNRGISGEEQGLEWDEAFHAFAWVTGQASMESAPLALWLLLLTL